MSVIKYIDCWQAHPVPRTMRPAYGPFPAELYEEPEVINAYDSPLSSIYTDEEDNPPLRWVRCADCHARVLEDEAEFHECEDLYDA